MGESDNKYDDLKNVVTLTDDRSRNGAKTLSTSEFSLTLNPVPANQWPGLGAGSDEVRFDTDAMRATVDDPVTGACDRLVSAMTSVATANPVFGPPEWAAATVLKNATDFLQEHVFAFVGHVESNLLNFRDAVVASAAGYDDTEAANTDEMSLTNGLLDGQPVGGGALSARPGSSGGLWHPSGSVPDAPSAPEPSSGGYTPPAQSEQPPATGSSGS